MIVMITADDRAVENFRSYLRIKSVQPDVDYSGCVPFLTNYANELGLKWKILEFTENKPIVWMTKLGSEPELDSIVLNSHMDVVAVNPEYWDHDPFEAFMDQDGNIFARGSQDTKGIGIQYLEAIRRLIQNGEELKRTVHILFVPDEEDGIDGMEQLVASSEFADLKAGFVLDEGEANPGTEFFIFYAEKAIWHVVFRVTGTAGHGSLPIVNTAGEKMRRLIDRVMDYRQQQVDKLSSNPALTVGDITFVNFTMMNGGIGPNVVPAVFEAVFDFRLAVDEDAQKFENLLRSWCDESGDGIEINFINKEPVTPPTAIDESNPFWMAMKKTFDSLNQSLITTILPGGTDSRFLRRVGVPCIAFSPMNNTPSLAHANNEFLNKDVFLRGIQVRFSDMGSNLNDIAVENFRTYLRIPSVHPNVNYDGCVAFLEQQAKELNLKLNIYTFVENKPVVVLTWEGTDPKSPSILLNSHMDVVPVYPELWTHDPFAADMDDAGNIYARGSQDMKCVGIQYLETVRRLQNAGLRLKRTLHLTFVPEEEVGGHEGMELFVKSDDFRALNVGFGLDEGYASPTDTFAVSYAERAIWHVEFKITGTEGHGSLLLPNTAGEKLRKLLDIVIDFRQAAVDQLANDPELTIGDVTSANITEGGVEPNVVPPELTLVVDMRLAIDVDHDKFEKQILAWCEQAGGGISISFIQKNPPIAPTILDDSNPYWVAIQSAFNKLNLKIKKVVFPGGTDSRYCRDIGIPVIGFSPMNNTPVLLHANDEFLNKDIFLRGIEIYEQVISAVGNL